MKTPAGLVSAVDCGIIEEVLRPLMSGKEAQVYVVVAGGVECVAKVYKEASQRTFKHRSEYTEGRRTRNSRDQRAVSKRSRHGRSQDEAGWRRTEVDMIYRLHEAGVRVPAVINFVDGVLVMEMIKDADGNPAPRLGDLSFSASEARGIHRLLLGEVARMLCAGVIHGDLSEFNVLMGAQGPVLIDFPQSMDPARNQGARKFLLRDVENLNRYVQRHAPGERRRTYGEEMWSLYEANRLAPDSELRGDYRAPESKADTGEVLALIEDADRDEYARREARGEAPSADALSADDPALEGLRPMRTVVDFTKEARPRRDARKKAGRGRSVSTKAAPMGAPEKARPQKAADASVDAAPKKKRSRRRRKKSATAGREAGSETKATGRATSTTENSTTAKKTVVAAKAGASKKRRRVPRGRTRSESGEGKASAPSNTEQPARQDADRRGGSRSAGQTARPARRRRKRPRSAGSREST